MDPILSSHFQKKVLRWVVILLISPHPYILRLLCYFLVTCLPWKTFIYPLIFHIEGVSFILWDMPFTKSLHLGATYILTWVTLVMTFSLHKHILWWWCLYNPLWINLEEDTTLHGRDKVYTRTLPSLQFLKTSLSWDLGLKCCNQPSPPIQLPQFILKTGRQPLQDMFKTNNQPLQFMLGEKLQSPMIHTNITSSTTVIHVGESSQTFVHHVGDEPLSSTNQAESMSPAIMNNVGAIHMIEKPPSIGNNPKFLCRLCKWCHLTLLCPNIVVIEEV